MPRVSRGPHLFLKRRKDGGDVWYIRDGDKRISTGVRAGDHTGARSALERYLARTARPQFGDADPASVPLASVIALYAQEVAPRAARPKEAMARLLRLEDYFGGMVAAEVTPSTCLAYAKSRGAMQAARRELEDLRAALVYAWKARKIAIQVPVTLPEKSAPRERWLTRGEAVRLLWAARGWQMAPCSDLGSRRERWVRWGRTGWDNGHVARFVILGLLTGTRHDAILGLGWHPHLSGGHVDMEHRLIYRRGTGERQTKKRRPPFPISDSLYRRLAKWQREPNALYVVTFDGTRMDRMQRAWRGAVRRAGLSDDVTPHVLRHTFVTWELQRGTPIWIVAGLAGMEIEILEKVYGHHSPEYLRHGRARA